MSIEFFLNIHGKRYHSGMRPCWIHVDHFLKELKRSKRVAIGEPNYLEPTRWRTVPPRLVGSAGQWSLTLDLRPDSIYGNATTLEQRKKTDRMFDEMCGKMLEGYITSKYVNGVRRELTYGPHTPFFLLGSTAGMYRMYQENMGVIVDMYDMIGEWCPRMRPWTKFYLASVYGRQFKIIDVLDPDKVVPFQPASGHMPFATCFGTWGVIKRMSNWWQQSGTRHMGMAEEYNRYGALKLTGRDKYFSGSDASEHRSLTPVTGKPIPFPVEKWAKKMAREAGIWSARVVKVGRDPWTGRIRTRQEEGVADFKSFIINVVEPIDRSKRA